MDPVDSEDPRIANARPGWALVVLAAPVAMVIVVGLAYGGLVAFGLAGRPATGPEVTLAFSGCPEARPFVEARVADMGLPATFSDDRGGFSARIVLPRDPYAAADVAPTLARTGAFEVLGGDEVLARNAQVTRASVRLDLSMTPTTLVDLGPDASVRVRDWVRAHPDAELEFRLDGETVGVQPARSVVIGEAEISPPIPDDRARMRATAAWGVVIDHGPLPCPVTVAGGPAPAQGGASSR